MASRKSHHHQDEPEEIPSEPTPQEEIKAPAAPEPAATIERDGAQGYIEILNANTGEVVGRFKP